MSVRERERESLRVEICDLREKFGNAAKALASSLRVRVVFSIYLCGLLACCVCVCIASLAACFCAFVCVCWCWRRQRRRRAKAVVGCVGLPVACVLSKEQARANEKRVCGWRLVKLAAASRLLPSHSLACFISKRKFSLAQRVANEQSMQPADY